MSEMSTSIVILYFSQLADQKVFAEIYAVDWLLLRLSWLKLTNVLIKW